MEEAISDIRQLPNISLKQVSDMKALLITALFMGFSSFTRQTLTIANVYSHINY